MRGERHLHLVQHVRPFGMMVRFLRGERDARHERERRAEILELQRARDRLAVVGQRPAVESVERRSRRIPVHRLRHRWFSRFRCSMSRRMSDRQTLAPDIAALERLADAAIARMPAHFRKHLDGVVLRVQDFPDDAMLAEFGMEDPFELTGLYTGRPIGEQSSMLSGELPAMIHLFRRPLLDEWVDTGVALEDLITHVIVHEAGHHFGFSDADMHAIEDAAG